MKEVKLERQSYTPISTFGVLWVAQQFWWAIEPPWRGNEDDLSCIPTGVYDLLPCMHNISTPSRKDDYPAYEIAGVPGRNGIHIHIGNTVDDTTGCVLIGNGFGILSGRVSKRQLPAVLSSRIAFEQFMAVMGGDVGKLEVVNACPDEFQVDWRRVDV